MFMIVFADAEDVASGEWDGREELLAEERRPLADGSERSRAAGEARDEVDQIAFEAGQKLGKRAEAFPSAETTTGWARPSISSVANRIPTPHWFELVLSLTNLDSITSRVSARQRGIQRSFYGRGRQTDVAEMAIARRVLGPIKTKLPLSSLADDLPRRLAFAGESSDPAFGLRQSLLDNLRQARWRAGQKLPPERQMCALYSVSRSTVRRVLAELKALGLITQKVGSGTYVAEDVAERLPEDAAEPASISPAELMEARLAFEPSLIDLVIRNGTATDFSELETCCRNGDVAPSLEVFEYWDGLFHQKLAQATHNSFVLTVFALISKMRDNAEWGLLKRKSATPERRANYQREHWAVLAALRNRDADTARHALLEHLRNVRRNMFTP